MLAPSPHAMPCVQADGNLRIDADCDFTADGIDLQNPCKTTGYWYSNTYNRGAVRLAAQTDGNLVLYSDDGCRVWHSRTYDTLGRKDRAEFLLQVRTIMGASLAIL